eukprot:COSAG01_NODE_2465_length_7642_cov_11.032878_10_plen_144_part_00
MTHSLAWTGGFVRPAPSVSYPLRVEGGVAGCGLSDHLPRSTMYVDLAESRLIVEVADELAAAAAGAARTGDRSCLGGDGACRGGWSEPFLLLGHSRGGAIATITAAAFPHRISALGESMVINTTVPVCVRARVRACVSVGTQD